MNSKAHCPICSGRMVRVDLGCVACQTPYHLDCFSAQSQCAIRDCGGQRIGPLGRKPAPPKSFRFQRGVLGRVQDALSLTLSHPELLAAFAAGSVGLVALSTALMGSGSLSFLTNVALLGLLGSLLHSLAVVVWAKYLAAWGVGETVYLADLVRFVGTKFGRVSWAEARVNCLAGAGGMVIFYLLAHPELHSSHAVVRHLPIFAPLSQLFSMVILALYTMGTPLAAIDDPDNRDPLTRSREIARHTLIPIAGGYLTIVTCSFLVTMPIVIAMVRLGLQHIAGDFPWVMMGATIVATAVTTSWHLVYQQLLAFEWGRMQDPDFMPKCARQIVG